MDNEIKFPINFNRLLQHSDLLIALALLGTLVMMILPIPPLLMDVLLVASLTMSIAILLVSVYMTRPLDFSVFPTVLLFATLFRLSLNVATTRLVLLRGHEGASSAGHVIETFGKFVVGGSYVVGIVIFILLIIINFVVITKGSGRVAEVAARFILDAMPGKQMSIDADLNAGIITEEQARDRRKKIESEADFYGAMDGASKFVRGDAIAGILITLINIIGGLCIGVFQRNLDLAKAAELYTLMTIGDGLVTQIPSLIVSTAAGIVVTRAASGNNLSREVASQLFLQPRAMGITGGIVLFLGILPGIPLAPFAFMGGLMCALSWAVRRYDQANEAKKKMEDKKQADATGLETTVPPEVDQLELQVGYGLVNLVDAEQNGDLVDRIYQLRKEFAKDLGLVIPKVRIKDNLELGANEYGILIKGVRVGGGTLMPGSYLAMDPGGADNTINGIETKEPVFGLPALWVSEKNKEKAQVAGYTVVDNSTIVATHLSETIRKHAFELVGRQELQGLVDNLGKSHPKVIEELIPTVLPLGTVLKVCQNLLREQVPIRDLLTIMECLANHAVQTKDPEVLTEYVRAALARTITHRLTQGTHDLEVITLEPRTEEQILRAYHKPEGSLAATLNLEPGFFERFVKQLQGTIEQTVFSHGSPVLLCHPLVRGHLKKLIDRFIPNLNIVTANEIAPFARVRSVATLAA